jgi:hypothetical protein
LIVRTFVTLLYTVVVVVALLVQFVYPVLALYVLYGLLAWFVASLVIYRLPIMSRPLRRAGPTGTPYAVTPAPSAPTATGAPLASGDGAPLSFCTYCAHPIEPGTPVCPECGRRIAVF